MRTAGEIFGYYVITRQYYDRYHLPVMHTETNLGDAERAPAWLWKEWVNRLYVVQPDRPGGLGHHPARGQRPRQPVRPL